MAGHIEYAYAYLLIFRSSTYFSFSKDVFKFLVHFFKNNFICLFDL